MEDALQPRDRVVVLKIVIIYSYLTCNIVFDTLI